MNPTPYEERRQLLTPAIVRDRDKLELERTAAKLASMERESVMRWYPHTWRRHLHYLTALEFGPGLVLVVCYGRRSEALTAYRTAVAELSWCEVRPIAKAWSVDRRAWTAFVKSSFRQVRDQLVGIAPEQPQPHFGDTNHDR